MNRSNESIEPTRFERLRAWAEQGGSSTALEPELRDLADAYRSVHALTGLDADANVRSQLAFESLATKLDTRRSVPLRRVAAAAICIATIAGVLAWRARDMASSETLVLQHIPAAMHSSDARAPAADDVPLPASFAEFDPRGSDKRVAWLEDADDAKRLARIARRPLLVYGYLPGCPLCAALDKLVFRDDGVVEAAERFVPMRMNLALLPKARMHELVERGYPFLEVWTDDGTRTAPLAREPNAATFVESLLGALVQVQARDDAPSWEIVRARAQKATDARAAETAAHFSEAEREYESLAASRAADDELARIGRAGLARIARDASARVAVARARRDVSAARDDMRIALAAYRGTRYEPDFAALFARIERDGCFPHVAFATVDQP